MLIREPRSTYGAATSTVLAVADRLGLENTFIERLLDPKEVIRLRLSPRLSDGRVHNIPAYLIRHSDWLGPSKGGVRMAADVDESMIRQLALEMTLKNALIGVPFGGGKAGIEIDPLELSRDDKEVVIRSFTNLARRHLGPEIYVPVPDIGTSEREMGFVKDSLAYGEGYATTRGCCVTGKPVVLGGIPGRREATGYGAVLAVQSFLQRSGRSLADARLAIQGFGNVGSVFALHAIERGAQIVAVADVSGAVWKPNGLDVKALQRHVVATGVVAGFAGADTVDSESFFEIDCDVFVPAAVGDTLDASRARRLRTSLVAEAANGPTTPDGDAVFRERGIDVIPDILCNAGGVFVSYLEYTQETQRDQWTKDEVNRRLENRMVDRLHQVCEYASSNGLLLREAAVETAVLCLQEAIACRGLLT